MSAQAQKFEAKQILNCSNILDNLVSTHFVTVSLWSMFSFIQPLFLQKTKTLYPHTPNIYLGLEFEFRSQRVSP